MPHNTRNWSAVETTDFAGGRRKLTVSGEVETLGTNEVPALAEATPQGINPTVLLLDLTVSSSGIGGHVVQWKPVSFVRHVSHHEYHEVTVADGDRVQSVKVLEAVS